MKHPMPHRCNECKRMIVTLERRKVLDKEVDNPKKYHSELIES
jgi:hypothetical protein